MATYPTTSLQPGSSGAEVKQLQDYLVSRGLLTQTQVNTGYGTYGPQTTAAVLALQKQLGIDYSSGPGYYGPKTLAALQPPTPAPAPAPAPANPLAPFKPLIEPFKPLIQPFLPQPAPAPAPAQPPAPAPVKPAPAPAKPKTFPDPTPLSDPSIINFLNAIKMPSGFPDREKLATQYGIKGYTGSEPQNTSFLTLLRDEFRQTGAIGHPASRPGDTKKPAPAPGAKPPVAKPPTATPATNPSVIDFLTSLGLPSDRNSRKKLAQERGITGYTGSGPQNERLLEMLRGEYDAGTFGQPQKPGAKPEEKPPAPPKKEEKPAEPSPADKQAEIDKLNQAANTDQDNEFSIIDTAAKGKVDLSTSTGLVQQLIELLGTQKTQQESAPSLEQKFVAEREKLGIGTLETSLAKADTDLKKLDADYASTIEEEEGRQVSMTQIRRRQSAEEVAYNRLRRDLVVERDSIANQLNQKYGVLNAMVKFAGEDYDNAQQNYQFRWNAAMQMTNLVKGIEDSAKTDQERKVDNARANVQIMFNLLKEGNIDYDALDEASKLDIKNMEIQAGFPVGFTKFVSETVDEPVVHFGSEFTDASGNRIQPVYVVDKDTGNLTQKNINLGQGTTGKDKLTEPEKLQKARSGIVAYFNTKKGGDGYVSPADFKTARNAWAADGLADEDFLKGFKNWANPDNYEDYDNSYF